ncbi:tRNA 2-selenouridine(34) synthase MnmH [Salinispirillum sp. LH 10-3-1]|uniref:tRNA 2-selenouridine synthase n=1 Tax=Salinispirillum sp. LH 10-3-1 TaxID=2952525 RepID=A0AB38YHG5_9GAMM
MRANTEDYRSLFLKNVPLMDVRAPVEFAQGAFPNAINLPLLDDQQRHDIGLRYKEQGEQAAIALGNELATETIRTQRLTAWKDFITKHPEGYLYCFRGGLRSRTTQRWLHENGIDYPLVVGGYKAMRRFLLESLRQHIAVGQARVITGPTGSGKTELIHAWPHSLDLEGLARHRGSAFGGTFVTQPAQIDWENALAVQWLQHAHQHSTPVLLEDESRLIGRVFVPPELQALLQQAPALRLEVPLSARIQRLRHDYVQEALTHLQQQDAERCWTALEDYIGGHLQRIRKRLGGERLDRLMLLLPEAVAALRDHQDWGGFDTLIRILLTEYYDPTYEYLMQKAQRPVVARGGHEDLLHWLQQADQ